MSWVSLILTFIAAIGGIIGYVQAQSTLILAFGLENVVDFMSSAIVLWRFYCPDGADEAKLAKLRKREERASVAISMVIGILGAWVFSEGVFDLCDRDQDLDQDLDLLFTISFVSIIVFGALTIIKFQYSRKFDSASLYKDGICSLIGTCLSGSLLLTTAIIDKAPNAWCIDPIVSLLIGLSAIVYGWKDSIFHKDWWLGKEAGTGAMTQELPVATDSPVKSPPSEEEKAEHEVI